MAANIFDRYIHHVGYWNVETKKLVCLYTISMIMAAKLEESIEPSFSKIIKLLDDRERQFANK